MASKKTKRNNKNASSTPGIAKGPNCRKTELKVRFAKDSRFYKTDPLNYALVEEEIRKLNK